MASTTITFSPASTNNFSSALSLHPLKAVLFDVDGTLCHSDPFHQLAYKELLAPHGIIVDEDWFKANISGNANSVLRKTIVPHLNDEEGAAFFTEKERIFCNLSRRSLRALDGLIPLISHLHSNNIKVAAVTNAPAPTVQIMLEILELASRSNPISANGCKGSMGWFDTVVLGEECEKPKPSPDAYLLAMKRLGVSKDESLVFEDSISGAKAGIAAGVRTIGVLTSKTEEEMVKIGCFAVIKDYTQINMENIFSMENLLIK